MDLIITLIAAALLLFFFEIFVPGGILGTAGLLALIWASYETGALYGAMAGIGVFMAGMLVGLIMLIVEMKVLSKTRFGKKLFLRRQITATSAPPPGSQDLVGQIGEVLTALTPGGQILLEGRKYEAASRDGHLSKGERVRVVGREAFRLVVEKTTDA